MTPTIEQVLKCYKQIALVERMKNGSPGEETVNNVKRGVRAVCEACGLPLSSPVTDLTRQRLERALGVFMQRGLTRLTALTYMQQVKALFARWCTPYYKDAGFDIPPLEYPRVKAKAQRYVRPPAELLQKVKQWYKGLTGEKWFAATMMLEFGMRNGDVLRLRKENFVTKGDEHFLHYVPHKTELSSARRVYWPIHSSIWEKFMEYGGLDGLDIVEETFHEINRDLRALGFTGSKGAYELRKICIDHIYQKFGAEMATSISGDSIRTVSMYYADPSQPNIKDVRVTDLL